MQSNAPPARIVEHGDCLKVRAESTKQKAAKTKKKLSHWQIGRREGFVCLELIMIKIKSSLFISAQPVEDLGNDGVFPFWGATQFEKMNKNGLDEVAEALAQKEALLNAVVLVVGQ